MNCNDVPHFAGKEMNSKLRYQIYQLLTKLNDFGFSFWCFLKMSINIKLDVEIKIEIELK